MSQTFREYLKKVGSGQHTKKDLTRSEAAIASRLMFQGEATPAQIGAFLIAHRIKRPTGEELAGFLDTYDQLGAKLALLPDSFPEPVIFGVPYDGRTRTAPILPITALLLATAGIPVILHGAGQMPTKYGLSLLTLFQAIALDFLPLSLPDCQALLEQNNFTFYYTPHHFPQSRALNEYRDQIGKRPPLATLDMIWSPYAGPAHQIIGYVHPPTETMIQEALTAKNQRPFTLVKGLEGSCDLRLAQTNIISLPNPTETRHYLKLNARDYDFVGPDIPLTDWAKYGQELQCLLAGQASVLTPAAVWNGGFYLWHCGVCPSLEAGLQQAKEWIEAGHLQATYQALRQSLA
jgi:anthranilate phosphoribosyltransferase